MILGAFVAGPLPEKQESDADDPNGVECRVSRGAVKGLFTRHLPLDTRHLRLCRVSVLYKLAKVRLNSRVFFSAQTRLGHARSDRKSGGPH